MSDVDVVAAIHISVIELEDDQVGDWQVQFQYPEGFERNREVKQAETRLANQLHRQGFTPR